MFGSIQESVILDSGTSKTIRANLTKIREDRIRFEQEKHDLCEEINMKARQVLAEAAIHARPSNHAEDLAVSFDYRDASISQMEVDKSPETTSCDEEDDGDEGAPMASHDGQAVTTSRAHVIAWYWKHDKPDEVHADQQHTPASMFHVSTVDITCKAHKELANVSLLKLGFLSCSPLQPTVAVSLHCLELYHQIRH
ncbi:hypothetical protein F4604DRAFT_1677288 [Suillus subluteus]|nr:hypothetical protein F4604DRAFT_1677288 [Suillus subluteus]